MTQERIEQLEALGFKRWTKGAYDRLYINAGTLGLVCAYYKTGNVKSAEFNGEYVRMFGGITKRKALQMFRTDYEIQQDRMGWY